MATRLTIRAFAAVLGVSILPSVTAAQLPAKPENLQVLPKDMPTDTVVAIMRGVTLALGVRCQFCHVEREAPAAAPGAVPPPAAQPGPGGPGGGRGNPFQNFDFKLDDKDHKKIARIMMRMTDSVNNKFLASIPNRDNPPTNVTCMTCHRGLSKPGNIETVIVSTTERAGVDSAIARYRALRNDMATGRYNFTEQPVSDVARRLSAQGKNAEAIKLLEMLQEFYPNSANIDIQIAETQVAAGNRDQAIARYRAVLAKNPNDRRAQQALQRLGVQP